MMKEEGVAAFYTGRARLGPEIVNPIGCADCHDETTMNAHFRPALAGLLTAGKGHHQSELSGDEAWF